ncbi:MAG: hypothetical protein IJ860_03015, partial [Eubacterium sp.]|nr:hypothetical protein [Eubacterium sp.]
QDVPPADITDCIGKMLEFFHSSYGALCEQIDETGLFSDEDKETILKAGRKFVTGWLEKKK